MVLFCLWKFMVLYSFVSVLLGISWFKKCINVDGVWVLIIKYVCVKLKIICICDDLVSRVLRYSFLFLWCNIVIINGCILFFDIMWLII